MWGNIARWGWHGRVASRVASRVGWVEVEFSRARTAAISSIDHAGGFGITRSSLVRYAASRLQSPATPWPADPGTPEGWIRWRRVYLARVSGEYNADRTDAVKKIHIRIGDRGLQRLGIMTSGTWDCQLTRLLWSCQPRT